MWNKIKNFFSEDAIEKIAYLIIGALILLDLIGNTIIPLSYHDGYGLFAIANVVTSAIAITGFVYCIKNGLK